MNSIKNTVWATLAIGLLAATANAQVTSPATEKLYLNANVGGQLGSPTLSSTAQQTIYDETATLTGTLPVGRGALVDLGAGYRVWRDVYAGIAFSSFSKSGAQSYSASVPDPLFFNRPKVIVGEAGGLKHREVAISPIVSWVTTLTDKIDLSVGLGVSIIQVKQEIISGFRVAAGTQNLTVLSDQESGTAKGVYAGVDFIYNLRRRYGVGAFVRYAGGHVDLPSAPDLGIGGLQAGGGIRLRF